MKNNKDYKKLIKSNLIEIYVWGGIWTISLFLSCLAIDLKLELLRNLSISAFVVSGFWILLDFIIICVYLYKDKKQKKENKLNEKE